METIMPWRQYGWSPSRAIVDQGFKFIESPKPELYDLRADPGELSNLHDRDLDRAEAMSRRMETFRAQYAESTLEGKSAMTMDDLTRDRLASLGYVFSGPTSGATVEDAADVKDMIELMTLTKRASDLHASGNPDEAISLLEEVLETSPDSRMVLNTLGTWYAQKGDLKNAERVFTHLIQSYPEYIEAYHNLGLLYADASRLDEATRLAEAVLTKLPRSAKAHGLMGIIRLKEQDYAAAVQYLDKAIEYYPTYHKALANRAAAFYFLEEFKKALADMARARRIMPQNNRYARFVDQIEKRMRSR
jgi:tetratricopeptide (TPR) repeat protein